jgi:hypothetical protein
MNYKPIMNRKTKILDYEVKLGSEVQAPADVNVEFGRESLREEVAVCIPSHPLQLCTLNGRSNHYLLTRWWEDSRHNIAVRYAGVPDLGPLFLVLEKRQSDQFTNCYYQGRERRTKVKLTGQIANTAQLVIGAGFSCQETGSFGFKDGLRQEGQQWAIFFRSAKMCIVWHKKLKSMIEEYWQ